MKTLGLRDFEALVDAALASGLADHKKRRLLLDGLPDRVRGALPRDPAPLDQLRSDLRALDRMPRLATGDWPLEVWLRAALAYAGTRPERLVFERILAQPDMEPPRGGSSIESDDELDAAIDTYLDWFIDQRRRESLGGLTRERYVEMAALDRGDERFVQRDYAPRPPRGAVIEGLRREVREVIALTRGGDGSDARQAAVRAHRHGQVVPALRRITEPVVLLGDPGSGKSMALREAGIAIAQRERQRPRPRLVVYVQLGRYRGEPDGESGDPMHLVRTAFIGPHAPLADALPRLVRDKRLVVLFDGIDEMERSRYVARIARLSRFASDYGHNIKLVFACRTNDFTPEFEHRQLLLLSLSRADVLRFVERQLDWPLSLDGAPHTARDLVDRIQLDDTFAESATNPLILKLLTDYIAETGAWPTSRRALFDRFVAALHARLESRADHSGAAVGSALTVDWAAIAFCLCEHGGVYVSLSTIEALFRERPGGAARAAQVLAAGEACGLLFADAEAGGLIRFAHHRLQEYLAAVHIHATQPVLAWATLLDTPRWQETLINLIALGGSLPVLAILEQTLSEIAAAGDGIRGLLAEHEAAYAEWKEAYLRLSGEGSRRKAKPGAKAALEEHKEKRPVAPNSHDLRALLAADHVIEGFYRDRVVLAARLIGELGYDHPTVPGPFRAAVRDAVVALATWGSPTTQVAMVSVCRLVPGMPMGEMLAAPLKSPVRWVRDQAVQAMVAVPTMRRTAGQDVPLVLALDVVEFRLLGRVSMWWRSLSQPHSLGQRWMLGWATACQVTMLLLLVANVVLFGIVCPIAYIRVREVSVEASWIYLIGLIGYGPAFSWIRESPRERLGVAALAVGAPFMAHMWLVTAYAEPAKGWLWPVVFGGLSYLAYLQIHFAGSLAAALPLMRGPMWRRALTLIVNEVRPLGDGHAQTAYAAASPGVSVALCAGVGAWFAYDWRVALVCSPLWLGAAAFMAFELIGARLQVERGQWRQLPWAATPAREIIAAHALAVPAGFLAVRLGGSPWLGLGFVAGSVLVLVGVARAVQPFVRLGRCVSPAMGSVSHWPQRVISAMADDISDPRLRRLRVMMEGALVLVASVVALLLGAGFVIAITLLARAVDLDIGLAPRDESALVRVSTLGVALVVVLVMLRGALIGLADLSAAKKMRVTVRKASWSVWLAHLPLASPRVQHAMLICLDPGQLDQATAETLDRLRTVEPHIHPDPARSAYWRLVHDLELRQRQLGARDGGSPHG